MSKKEKQILWFTALCVWIAIIFMDAISFSKSENIENREVEPVSTTHNSANIIWETTNDINSLPTNNSQWQFNPPVLEQEIIDPLIGGDTPLYSGGEGVVKAEDKNTQTPQYSELETVNIDRISLDDLSSKVSNRLEILKSLYKKTNDEKVLKVLVDELLVNYQFDEVRTYMSDIDIFSSSVIDKQSYIYTYINTLAITDPNSMKNFISFIEQMKAKNLISSDEFLFYKWLQRVWDWEYDIALETLKQTSNKNYSQFINQLESTIKNYKSQKWMPKYYEDALVSLTALKNWYFSIANKLAVEAILEKNDYILPYQVLAYSNFLTKKWDKAISYFYNLSSLDIENKNKYDFYLWISYYRQWEYGKSLTTLYQLISDSTYKTDVYRYLLLDYEQLGQKEKMVQIRQKLLWEYNLTESDFKYFYDIVFFQPFSQGEKSTIYENYRQISYDMVSICYDKFGYKNDTCIYWEVWFNITNWLRNSVEDSLLYLAQNYPQANIFQALWDYYKNNNDKAKAKSYYIKAISYSDDSVQKWLMESSLLNLMD